MYTKELLSKYKYFKALNKFISIEYMIDPLTGLISRKYMLEFIKELINEKTEFTLSILDLDNFKDVNDTYGHTAGDIVLENIGNDLINFLGDNGIAGRYGGDEFLIIIFNNNEYDDIHKFYQKMFHGVVLRKTYEFNNGNAFITGTVGSAAYPINATNFDDLFQMCDKTLYRGKMKGRNCFIIYVHEKHKDIDISKLIKEPIQNTLFNLSALFDKDCPINEKIISVIDYIKKLLKITAVYLFDENGSCFFGDDYNVGDLSAFIDENDMAAYNNINEIYGNDKKFDKFIEDYNLFSVLIGRIMFKGKCYGYIIFSDSAVQRIWQNEDMALMYFTIKLIGSEIVFNKLGLK